MIQIETEKIVHDSGIHGRKIIKFNGLCGMELIPEKYKDGDNCMWQGGTGLIFKANMRPNHECTDLIIGQFYSETEFQQSLLEIARCGGLLHDVNIELKNARTNWCGFETISI